MRHKLKTLRVDCVTDERAFLALAENWNQLARENRIQSVFLRHEWYLSAWEWLKTDSTLHIVCAYDASGLVGILPLVEKTAKVNRLPARTLAFLSVPDTQYCDMLTRQDSAAAVTDAFFQHLMDSKYSWDIIMLRYLNEQSNTYRLLFPKFQHAGWMTQTSADTANPHISLEDSWDEYYQRRSRRLKKGNNLIKNRLKKDVSEIEIKWFHGSQKSQEEIDELIEIITKISSGSWKVNTGLSLENPGPAAFIRNITELANRNGWLSVWLLLLDGTPVAMEYHLCYERYVHALRSDFLEDFEMLSPGAYLNWKIIEKLFSSNFTCYQMGPGNNTYKLRWCEGTDTVFGVDVYGKTMRGRLLGFIQSKLTPLVSLVRERTAKVMPAHKV